MTRWILSFAATLLLALTATPVAAHAAAAQTLTWTADDDVTRYRSAPATAVAGETTIVFENSAATGNTTGMPHTLTFDTSTAGYNHDVTLNILANPFDATDGRHQATVTLTPGRYRYFCAIPGHLTMVGELVVTDGGGEPDTTPPSVSAQVSGTRNAAGDYVGSATVAVTATDAGSGVATVEYEVDDTGFRPYTAPVAVTAPGDHAVQFRATDRAGNTSDAGSVQFRVAEPEPAEDTTPPVVTAQVTGARDGDGNYVGAATATLTATDTGSGVAGIEYALDGAAFTAYTSPLVIDAPGAHMLHYRATDRAGNTSAEGMSHFTVVAPPEPDTTPPAVTAAVTGERDGESYVGAATVTLTATDTESAVTSVEYAIGAWTRYTAPVTVRTAGTHTVRYRATDAAGNVAPERSVTFTVVPSGSGDCPAPDPRPTVVIGGEDTGVPNAVTGTGCTVNDLIAEHATYPDHAAFVRHVQAVTGDLVADGTLSKRQQGAIVRAAARAGA